MMATKVRKKEFAGRGAALQLLALLAPFVGALLGPPGIVAGLVALVALFWIGSQKSMPWACSDCRGRVDRQASVCPHCRATLG
jgi:hypothetical protein